MSKFKARRRTVLEDPEEVLNLAQRGLELLKQYQNWAIAAGIIALAALSAWSIQARLKESRETQAAETLAQLFPQGAPIAPEAKDSEAVAKFLRDYAGTLAARRAEVMQANMLYRLKQYPEAARAYEALRDGREPGLDSLIAESLSYCYERMGDFKKAAQVLKPVVEQTSGPMKSEVMQHLALLLEQAKEPGEAAVYWRKLLEQPTNPALVPYFQEKAAAAEAQDQK